MTVTAPAPARKPLARDLAVALLVAALLEVGSAASSTDDDLLPPPDPAGRLLVTAGALSLTFHRMAPLPVFTLNVGADLAYRMLGDRPAPLPLGVLVALVAVSLAGRPLVSGAAAAGYVAALVAGALTGVTPLDDVQLYVHLVSVAGAVLVGHGVALGGARAGLAEQQAAELARGQESRTLAAVEQEQARIAREVHDIVAGGMSVVVAQAAAARRVADREARAAVDALSCIETVGRDALDGLRRLLDLLRTDGLRAQRSPPPDLRRLPWLVDQVRRAGLPVELVVRGTPRQLPATVELNAYRIVQEALTNSLRHAGPTQATVTLTYAAESLGVEVRDQGHGAATSSVPGYGLIGMRERATTLGGDLAAGPDAGEGFRVTARLPAGSSG